MLKPVIAADELQRLLAANFPEMVNEASGLAIAKVWHGGCRVHRAFRPNSLRPGGTVSGPTLMMLADFSMYVAVLASVGWVPLAVTTNLNMNFLKKPGPHALEAECRLIKLGKRLAVGEVSISIEGEEELVAHATATYSIPSRG